MTRAPCSIPSTVGGTGTSLLLVLVVLGTLTTEQGDIYWTRGEQSDRHKVSKNFAAEQKCKTWLNEEWCGCQSFLKNHPSIFPMHQCTTTSHLFSTVRLSHNELIVTYRSGFRGVSSATRFSLFRNHFRHKDWRPFLCGWWRNHTVMIRLRSCHCYRCIITEEPSLALQLQWRHEWQLLLPFFRKIPWFRRNQSMTTRIQHDEWKTTLIGNGLWNLHECICTFDYFNCLDNLEKIPRAGKIASRHACQAEARGSRCDASCSYLQPYYCTLQFYFATTTASDWLLFLFFTCLFFLLLLLLLLWKFLFKFLSFRR